MNLLYFSPYYPPQSEAAATRSFWFIKTLEEAGHNVTIITVSSMKMKMASNKDWAIIRLVKEHLVGIELFLRILLRKADRVVLSSPPFFTVCWGALASWLSGKPYILDIRDLYPEVFFEMGLIKENSLLGKMAKAFTKLLYAHAKGIMTVTEGLILDIKKYGPDPKKIMLARNGFDSDLFYPGKTEEKFSKFSLVFHGTLGKAQNIETLLKLAAELEKDTEIEIVVAGDGPKLNDILNAKRRNIRYLGNISYSEIPPLLRNCHVGLSFRTDDKIGKEAFPVKVFEYIGSGLPTIISPKGEAGTMIEAGGMGWQYENTEIGAMAAKIMSLKSETNRNFGDINEFTRQGQSKKILGML